MMAPPAFYARISQFHISQTRELNREHLRPERDWAPRTPEGGKSKVDDGASQRSLGEEIRELRAIMEKWIAQGAPAGRQARIDAIMDSPGQPSPPPRRPKRDRHGMHLVRGCAVLAAMAGQWLARSRMHRALAGGLIMATATGATLAPDMMQQAPAAQLPPSPHHAVAHHHRREAAVPPPAVPGVRKRRRLAGDRTVRPSASVTPAASPAATDPGPEPSVTPDPVPAPLPTTPAPDPTCANLTGKHCHGGDGLGDAVRVPGALRGFRG